jgi:hypothetical protein
MQQTREVDFCQSIPVRSDHDYVLLPYVLQRTISPQCFNVTIAQSLSCSRVRELLYGLLIDEERLPFVIV